MKRQWIVALIATFALLGCSKDGLLSNSDASSSDSSSSGSQPTTTPGDYSQYDSYVPLAWEARSANTRAWSLYLFSVIDRQTPNLLNGTSDITQFCPKYSSLGRAQRIQFWAYLFSEVARYESAFDPLSRMRETSMGTDPVTGQPVYSEGLLQLSYQDIRVYPTCRLNWSADRNLGPTDPRKTILDPEINLQCGAIIMSRQVANKGLITVGSGAYWATLKSSYSNNKIAPISAATRSLPFCQ
jgi:hypothetical protein